MSIQLEIPEALFERIKKNAIPFVDLTPVSVLQRWADHFEGVRHQNGHVSDATPVPVAPAIRALNPQSPPDLTHTRCQGKFGKASFRKWNDLVRISHILALSRVGTFEALVGATTAQLRKGDHSGDSGFHFVREIGISIQGVDANHAWQHSLRLAQNLKVPIFAQVEWRHKDAAAFPGETAMLEWRP